jgi:hypothetical protein
MHIDSVLVNLDGSMTISLQEFLNPTVAATFVGATPSVQVTNPNPSQLNIVLTLTPAAPIAEQTLQPDAGGSASVDG